MGSRVQCFMLIPTDRVRLRLRRYRHSSTAPCPRDGNCCNAFSPLGEHPARIDPTTKSVASYDDMMPPRDDSRWPTVCEACGGTFRPEDAWQVFQDLIYRREDTGGDTILSEAPPGAMWDAEWWPARGPDGRTLCVAMPPNGGHDYWMIDGPAKGGGTWTRTGTPPLVTASPSILTPRYHGFLRNGWLEEC